MSTGDSTLIRAAVVSDAATVAEIYNHYIRETVVTFEESEISSGDAMSR